MTVRAVEWKQPYTWGTAIEIDENKVISLRLRDENNLIIYDAGDNEIYVDLQLPDELTPTDAFPVWITTGRVIVDNGWDLQWTLICAKTTSGDNIKLLYADEGTLWIDNWTWTFKQIYFKWDVDAIVQAIYTYINENANVKAFLIYWTEAQKKQKLWDAISYYVVSWKIPLLSMDSVTYTLINAVRWDGEGGTDDVYTFSSSVNSNTGKYKEVRVNVNSTTPISTTVDSYTVTEHRGWGWWSDIEYVTQAEYNALLPWAESDWKHYFIYSTSGWRLPAEYQEVEYIESSWTQWIDTWITPTQNTISQFKYMSLAYTWDVIYWMYTWSDNTDYRFFNSYWWTSNLWLPVFDIGSPRAEWSSWMLLINQIYELELWNFYIKNLATSTVLASSSTISSYTGWETITLNNYMDSSFSSNRWYYVKIWEWATQVRDFVPCYRIADSVIWMYDLVNDQFYTNSWSWTFTKWNDVN